MAFIYLVRLRKALKVKSRWNLMVWVQRCRGVLACSNTKSLESFSQEVLFYRLHINEYMLMHSACVGFQEPKHSDVTNKP